MPLSSDPCLDLELDLVLVLDLVLDGIVRVPRQGPDKVSDVLDAIASSP